MRNKILFTLFAMLFMAANSLRAQEANTGTAYVAYCEADHSLHFLCSEDELITGSSLAGGQTITELWSGDNVTYSGIDHPQWTKKTDVTEVVFEESFKSARPKSCYGWFFGLSNLTEIKGLENLDTSNVTNMNSMFSKCSSLTSLNLSSLKTSDVTKMSSMFYGCSALTSLDLSHFDTSSVTSIANMFSYCSNLQLLDLSKATIKNFSKLENSFSSYPLTFVPEGTTVPEAIKNVVVGNQCKHFMIDASSTANRQLLLSVPYKFTANKITINRNFIKDEPHTLYLPFAMNAQEYGTFYTYNNYDEGTGDVTFSELTGTQTEANMPYLFKPNKTGTIEITGEITVQTTPAEAQEENEGLVGVYTKKTFTKDEANQNIYYGWADGDFKRAGNGAKVDAGHAYLKLPAKAAKTAPMRLSVTLGGNGTTAINTTVNGANDESAPAYNLNGQRVDGGYRGMVIINGKKYIRK